MRRICLFKIGKVENGVNFGKKDYESISEELVKDAPKWWVKSLWKWKIPMKIKCFSWLCLMNKISNGIIYVTMAG